MLIRIRRRIGSDDDRGWAMLMVIASVFFMTILATGAITMVLDGLGTAGRDQDWQAAVQAADAGIDDYVARLQQNPNYWTVGNGDGTNPAMSGWTNVPGTATRGQFHYSVDTSSTSSNGFINLTAQGKVDNTTRTLSVRLNKESFLDYMYFTKYETIDPVAYASSSDQTAASTSCPAFAYAGRPAPSSGRNYCSPINFVTGDVLKGPVHSLDEIQFSGNPQFTDEFSTQWQDPAHKYYTCPGGGCSPSFAQTPKYSVVPFPDTNVALRPYADPTQGGTGCIFKGPTRILFGYSSGSSTITVTSPETSSSFNTGACGTHNWSTAQTIPTPTGQVIYIDGYTGSCSSMPAIGFPVSGDNNSNADPVKLSPNCHNGDAYVEGWVKGQVTIGTANNIIITNDIRYVGTNTTTTSASLSTGIPTTSSASPSSKDTAGTDLLGLSASNFIEIYHPLTGCTTTNHPFTGCSNISTSPYPLNNIQIDAALVASADSILVQDWDTGPDVSTLTVVGGLVQQFRGPVGTSGNTGYSKDYNYDSRLRTLTPPHLADLAASAWNVVSYSEATG